MRFLPFILLLILAGCSSQYAIKVEPKNQRTFSPDRQLKSGEIIKVYIERISENETLRFHLCGVGCNTATTIKTVSIKNLNSRTVIFTAQKTGDYYFWVKNKSVVPVVNKYETLNYFVVEFSSGTKLRVFK